MSEQSNIEVIEEKGKVVGVRVNKPTDYFTVERALNSKNKQYGIVSSEDFDSICDYYLDIKYNYGIPEIEKMMYKYISSNTELSESEINDLITEIVTKYEDDDR